MKTLIVLALTLTAMLFSVGAAMASAENCTDLEGVGWTEKVDTSDPDPATVDYTAPEGYLVAEYCVKAGQEQNDGGRALVLIDPASSTVTIDHPDKDSVSNWAVRLIETEQPEYVAPSADIAAECGEISGTLVGGAEEEWFQLFGPDGLDVWGAALTLQPGEVRTFTQELPEGTYEVRTSPRFPAGSDSTLRATVEITCPVPEPTVTPEPEPSVTPDPEPTPTETVTPDPVEVTGELPETGVGSVLLGLLGLSSLGGGALLLRRN